MIKGIDISHWQGNPDFKRVKAAGINYVLVKATEGVNYIDPCFKANIQAAVSAGLPVGAYHFLRAGDAITQAHDFLTVIKPYKITWPAVVDVEHTELIALGRDKLTNMVIDFCKQVRVAGYKPMVYSNRNWLYAAKYLDVSRIRTEGIPIWLAWYSSAAPQSTDRSDICDMWQYCSDGHVDGINGKVDCNVSYKDLGAAPFECDTTIDLARARGGWYQFKVTSKTHPKVNVGSNGVATILPRYQSGDDYFYYIIAYGAFGTATGVYVNDILQFNFKIK